MILRRSREFTVNMGNYESVKIGATVEIDASEYATQLNAYEDAERLLTEALANDVKEAQELTGTRDSFVLSWGVK